MPSYGPPQVMFVRGEGARLWDREGREYLDFLSGLAVTSLGHSHPRVAEALAGQAQRLLHVSNLFATEHNGPVAQTLDGLLDEGSAPVLLGVEFEDGDAGAAHFVVDLSHVGAEALLARSPGGELMDLRELVQIVPGPDSALIAYARGLTYWHRRHRFCGACGAPAKAMEAGHQRRCTNEDCGAVHFPRTDTAVITLVHDGDGCLLCRQSRWPPGMHSTLAGFLEPGESLSEAVVREVREESGIEVGSVRYRSSQPWPFPASLMLGFRAERVGGELSVARQELVDARWFERADFARRREIGLRLPGRVSISRRLIEDWLAG